MIVVEHGSVNSNCFIIDKKLAYITDVSDIYKKDYSYFKNLKYIIIDCLRYKKHPAHYNFDEVLEVYKILKPRKMILTNLHSDLDYKQLSHKLQRNIKPAFDGLILNF